MAVYDLWARAQGKPLYQLLGGARQSFQTDLTISVNPVDQMVSDSLEAVDRGFGILKVKVGKEGLADVDRMAAIRRAVGPDVRLRVDANQGWTAEQSVSIIQAMEDRGLDIELVEQPVPAHDLAGLKEVARAVDTPILADEAVFSHYDAARIIEERGRRPHQHQAYEDRRHLERPEDLPPGGGRRRGVHDRLYAGVPAVRGRRRPPGRRAENHHQSGPGRPLPVRRGPLHRRSAVQRPGDRHVGQPGRGG